MLLVPDGVCSDGWVMAALYALVRPRRCLEDFLPDLLADKLCGTCLILPLAQEQLAQERVQRLLLTAQLLASAGVLLLQCAEKPLQNECSASGGILLGSWCNEYGGVFCPVRGELGERGRRENERRRGHGGEIAIEGCDRLPQVSTLQANRMYTCTIPSRSYPTSPLRTREQQILLSQPWCVAFYAGVGSRGPKNVLRCAERRFRAVGGVVVTTREELGGSESQHLTNLIWMTSPRTQPPYEGS